MIVTPNTETLDNGILDYYNEIILMETILLLCSRQVYQFVLINRVCLANDLNL